MMLDFTGLRILQTILLRTSILIRILAHLKNVEVHGWMRLLLEVVYCLVMEALLGYPLPIWCAIRCLQ